MKNLIQAAVITLVAESAAQAQQAVQWKVSDGGNGHWYQVVTVPSGQLCWSAAQAAAAGSGAHLATINGSGEQAFLASRITATDTWEALIGGSRDPSSDYVSGWTWTTGEPFQSSVVQWASGNPGCCGAGEYWLGLRADGLHDLLECTTSVIWEWSADCNNDGIVDYGQCRDGSLPDYNGNNVPDCCEAGTPCAVGNYPVQWRAADGGTGHWYQLCPVGASPAWSACLSAAGRMGGTLACIGSAQEDAFVRSTQPGSPLWRDFGPWLGGFQNTGSVEPAGGWAWINGEPWTWAGWDAEPLGEPNNAGCGDGEENRLHYVACQGASPHWNDAPNSGLSSCCLSPMAVSSYIVEWSADCDGDGIVDKGQILRGQLPDTNNNGIPDGCEVPSCIDADIYRDFNVNGADLGILLAQWGPNTPLTESDLNADGAVDGVDLGILLSFWGPCP